MTVRSMSKTSFDACRLACSKAIELLGMYRRTVHNFGYHLDNKKANTTFQSFKSKANNTIRKPSRPAHRFIERSECQTYGGHSQFPSLAVVIAIRYLARVLIRWRQWQ